MGTQRDVIGLEYARKLARSCWNDALETYADIFDEKPDVMFSGHTVAMRLRDAARKGSPRPPAVPEPRLPAPTPAVDATAQFNNALAAETQWVEHHEGDLRHD